MKAFGLDVSHHQGAIAWDEVATAGPAFVAVKATEGVSYVDPRFSENWRAARRLGFRWRVAYHFANGGDPRAQAAHLMRTVGALHPGEGLCVDCEVRNVAESVYAELMAELQARTGRPPLYYSGVWVAGFDQLAHRYPVWLAAYVSRERVETLAGHHRFAVWQYTSSGRLPGIAGAVDLNTVEDPAALDRVCGLEDEAMSDEQVRQLQAGLARLTEQVDALEAIIDARWTIESARLAGIARAVGGTYGKDHQPTDASVKRRLEGFEQALGGRWGDTGYPVSGDASVKKRIESLRVLLAQLIRGRSGSTTASAAEQVALPSVEHGGPSPDAGGSGQ